MKSLVNIVEEQKTLQNAPSNRCLVYCLFFPDFRFYPSFEKYIILKMQFLSTISITD